MRIGIQVVTRQCSYLQLIIWYMININKAQLTGQRPIRYQGPNIPSSQPLFRQFSPSSSPVPPPYPVVWNGEARHLAAKSDQLLIREVCRVDITRYCCQVHTLLPSHPTGDSKWDCLVIPSSPPSLPVLQVSYTEDIELSFPIISCFRKTGGGKIGDYNE